jgi:phospholipid/cholesterol/gamma-HCH transport system substrate-binding protein
MQKQAPSIGRILVAAGFALSCFGLILFLWIAFGGPIPLKPESYRITAYFPEATQLAQESDVRIGGVSVGKVKTIQLAPPDARVNGKDTTKAEIEIEPEFAPISEDARAILRQKTLLGETYVELTSGTEPAGEEEGAPVSLGAAANVSDAEADAIESLEEGGSLGVGQTEEATQIDEIFNALDEETRRSFQSWQQNAAVAIQDRGLDLNDSLGNLGPFVSDASNVVEILNRQKQALKGLVRDTGTVFEALTAQDQALARAIVGSENTFEALAREDRALAESFQILPTFERESRLTFERLDEFQADTHPLVRDLIPVARDLSPTLRSVRRLSPDLRKLFVKLGKLETASEEGLPALERTLDGLAPVFDALDPFLANLNPALRYLEFQKLTMTDFMAGPGVALSGALDKVTGDPAPRHYLRQIGYLGSESLSLHPVRLPTNRGNGYNAPLALSSPTAVAEGMYASFDCKNPDYSPIVGGDNDEDIILNDDPPYDPQVHGGQPPDAHFAPCWTAGAFPASPFGSFGDNRAPEVFPDP